VDIRKLVALPVLSVRQPWASYIIAGIKTTELRSWPTEYRGWLWIHTGKQLDLEALEIFRLPASDFRTGGLLGIAKLASCTLIRNAAEWHARRNEHRSPGQFSQGIYAWVFRDTVALWEKIECRGELGLFRLDTLTRERVEDHLMNTSLQQDFVETVRDLPDPSDDSSGVR